MTSANSIKKAAVCFLSAARYSRPLDATAEKKFRALAALGELFIIGFSRTMRPYQFRQHAHFYLLPKLPLPLLRYAAMLVLGSCLTLWLIVRHRVQVLVAQSPFEGVPGAAAKRIAGWFGRNVGLVVESHGDFEESLFLQRRVVAPNIYRFLMGLAVRFALKHADLLRAVSSSTKQQLERWAPNKPLHQFPAWTDIEVFLHAGLNEASGPSQDILYAGSLIPRKGVHHLINVFGRVTKDFPQAGLIIVGHAENKTYAGELKEQVRRLRLDGRVQFAGQVPQEELANRMRRACVFVLPSYSEGLPRVIFEAMAAGLPTIGSAVSGIPEVLHDGVVGFLVPPGNETSLAARLHWVLGNPDQAREMGRRGRAFAERFFSTDAYIQWYRQVFETVQALTVHRAKHAHSPF